MKISHKIVFVLFQLFSGVFKLFGLRATRLAARFLGTFCYYFIPIRKKVVFENLEIAFPQKSRQELKIIARRTYQNILTTFFELIYFPYTTRNEMKLLLSEANMNEAEMLLKENKGLVFWTGHFGSWEVGAASAAIHLGKPFNVLAKKQSNAVMNELLVRAREVHGNKMIWLGASVRHLIEVLKNGGIVGVVGDQRGPADSPRVSFFGRPTPFYTGTATIISRTNCNAIFGVVVRQNDGNYKCEFEKLEVETLPIDPKEKVKEINQRYANFLEKNIRQYPDQYFWMHKIWKY
ncbi:MAG: lipid A biosynthesis acyltransferase [Stygiobacter sp.]|nr:MAG: lipid A biosynthesis acyltransferase [Stygiobacter sp.]